MLRKHIFKDKAEKTSIRWRLHEPTRLEAFSDAVFAFALTLAVIALEVPETFDALLHLMKGFFGFAICFLLVVLIWHEQYVFFRRFGLQDTRTHVYNLALLFMVILLVYPLKFLFYSFVEGFNYGHRFSSINQVCQLMIIYGVAYFIIYVLFLLMYLHALRKKNELSLSRLEQYNTRTYIYTYIGRLIVISFSLFLAVYGIDREGSWSFFSGVSYSLFGVAIGLVHARRGKKIKKLFTQEEIDEVMNEVVVIKERHS
jgi:uncharacterized membrane protein